MCVPDGVILISITNSVISIPVAVAVGLSDQKEWRLLMKSQ